MTEHFRKKANARIKGADAVGADEIVTAAMGGLVGRSWVGGEVVLTDTELTFRPNVLNKRIQKGAEDATFSVDVLTGACITGGFGTKIIAVTLANGAEFEFRCTKAPDVLATLSDVIEET